MIIGLLLRVLPLLLILGLVVDPVLAGSFHPPDIVRAAARFSHSSSGLFANQALAELPPSARNPLLWPKVAARIKRLTRRQRFAGTAATIALAGLSAAAIMPAPSIQWHRLAFEAIPLGSLISATGLRRGFRYYRGKGRLTPTLIGIILIQFGAVWSSVCLIAAGYPNEPVPLELFCVTDLLVAIALVLAFPAGEKLIENPKWRWPLAGGSLWVSYLLWEHYLSRLAGPMDDVQYALGPAFGMVLSRILLKEPSLQRRSNTRRAGGPSAG